MEISNVPKRNKPGTKSSDLYYWAPEEFSKKKGLFAVQEYIQELIREDPSDIKLIITPPKDVDILVWKYEHIRQFILETNLLIVQLQGICTKHTCPRMKATEDWLYLCDHTSAKTTSECSAIDYMIHNIDQFTLTLNNSKYFKSRVAIESSSSRYLDKIVSRLYRIYSHTHFHHSDIFQEFVKVMHLCERFTEFVKMFDILEKKALIIPSSTFKKN